MIARPLIALAFFVALIQPAVLRARDLVLANARIITGLGKSSNMARSS